MSASAEAAEPLGLLGRVDLPGVPESVACAREYVRQVLAGARYREWDDVVLLVSELVSNAVRHSDSGRRPDGRVTVTLAHVGDVIHVEVLDAGSPANAPLDPGELDLDGEGGRGLWLVNEVSAAWGWHEVPGGRVVWFQTEHNR
ncbi:ATP-binding protein [Thermopolyspora sp. NPDC052614]|uniref:ATP-binding protein n=1 Tax=Thermopolyspora sp. NPDC052614 TaxID=3155682 RepID=UPI00343F3E72